VQVEIKRTIPKGSMQLNNKDFKTKKIFAGGLPSTLTEGNAYMVYDIHPSSSLVLVWLSLHMYLSDDFKSFFMKYGTVVDHQIMCDHETKRSRGFGFIVFGSEQIVDDLLANGNMIDLAGSKVSVVLSGTIVSHMVTSFTLYLWCNISKLISEEGKHIPLFKLATLLVSWNTMPYNWEQSHIGFFLPGLR
jgi:RNA recognition motif-containing protein